MTKAEKAKEFFNQGFNCSQSVALAFAAELNLPQEVILKLSSSFGGGMGGLREVCGAVSGMFIVAGFLYGYDDPQDPVAKAEHYKRIQDLAIKFKEKHPSIICRELLGYCDITPSAAPSPRTAEYYAQRPCAELVLSAAQIMQDYIDKNPPAPRG